MSELESTNISSYLSHCSHDCQHNRHVCRQELHNKDMLLVLVPNPNSDLIFSRLCRAVSADIIFVVAADISGTTHHAIARSV
jgi:hypothetical protein